MIGYKFTFTFSISFFILFTSSIMYNIKYKKEINNNNGLKYELAFIEIIKTFQRNKDGFIQKIESSIDFNFTSHKGCLKLIQQNYINKSEYNTTSNCIIFRTDQWLNNIKYNNKNNFVYSYYGDCVIDLTNEKLIFFKLKYNPNDLPIHKKLIKLYWGKFGQYYKLQNGITTKRFTTIKNNKKEKIVNDYICSITLNFCNRFINYQTNKREIIYSFTQILEDEINWNEIYLKDFNDYKNKLKNPLDDTDNFFFTSYLHYNHNKNIINKYKGKLYYKSIDIPYDFKNKIFSTLDIQFNKYN